jgi:ferredoxin
MYIPLYFFSGTGNTAFLAKLYDEKLTQKGHTVTLEAVETYRTYDFSTAKADMIGLFYPVHAFNAPQIVFDFIDGLPKGKEKPFFIVKSPGSPFLRGGSSRGIISAIKSRGYVVFHESLVVMPSNFYTRYDDLLSKRIVQEARRRADFYTDEIIGQQKRLYNYGALNTIFSDICHLCETKGATWFGLSLYADDTCSHCRLCVNNCPTGNITMPHKRVFFGSACQACLRCVYNCPERAIKSKFFQRVLIDNPTDPDRIDKSETLGHRAFNRGVKGYSTDMDAYMHGSKRFM